MKNNIKHTKTEKACCSCGICAGICPAKAISMNIKQKTGELLPHVNEAKCTQCGICLKVCPGLATAHSILADTPDEHTKRQCAHTEAYTGYILDKELLEHSTSGGIVSELVRTLLTNSIYESAFLVNTNHYADVVKSERVTAYSPACAKSRYIAVSHEKASEYMLAHRDERIIIVAVGCAINGFRKLISEYRLDSDNYLLIGLFCDKIMTYRIWDYFRGKYGTAAPMTGLDFRNKAESGWPGDMRLYFNDKALRVDRTKRMRAKNFFQNERCLYCADKLNESADISVGDNYTEENAPIWGSSSIIVRTAAGQKALDQIRDKCTLTPVSAADIFKSQKMRKKQRNFTNARFRYQGLLHGKASCKDLLRYIKARLMIVIGRLG